MKTFLTHSIFLVCMIVLSLFVTRCARAAESSPWSGIDKTLFAAYIAESAYDAAQTDQCLKAHRCTETNPLLGSNPSTARLIGTKLIVGAGIYWLADSFPQQRRWILIIGNALEISVIANNARLGFNVKF